MLLSGTLSSESLFNISMRHPKLTLEFCCFFILLPGLLAFYDIRSSIFIILWVLCFMSMHWLHKHTDYKLRQDWNAAALTWPALRTIFLRFGLLAALLTLFTFLHDPEKLFSFPRDNFSKWLMVMALYPALSVLPQEIIFRSLMFRRYAPIFTSGKAMLLASALTFGWAHIVMHTWISVTFSAIGGVIFASTYARTKSLAAVFLEHTLYGCFIFTVGLGWYFYHANGIH